MAALRRANWGTAELHNTTNAVLDKMEASELARIEANKIADKKKAEHFRAVENARREEEIEDDTPDFTVS